MAEILVNAEIQAPGHPSKNFSLILHFVIDLVTFGGYTVDNETE